MTAEQLDLLLAARDIRLLATVWATIAFVFFVAAVAGWVAYGSGVRVIMPRLRRRIRELGRKNADLTTKLEASIVEVARMRAKAEKVGLEAEKEIRRVDTIRKRTEGGLTAAKSEIEDLQTEIRDLKTVIRVHTAGASDACPAPPADRAGPGQAAGPRPPDRAPPGSGPAPGGSPPVLSSVPLSGSRRS